MTKDLKSSLLEVQNRIAEVAKYSKRDHQDIHLIAVSKTKPSQLIAEAYKLGVRDFAENYVQELVDKSKLNTHEDLKWHFIGHLQSNKVREVVGRAHLIHTLDRPKLALKIQDESLKQNTVQKCLIQIKLSKEDSKTGCLIDDLDALLETLKGCPNVQILGLMTIGSLTDDHEVTRGEYKALKDLFDNLNRRALFSSPLTVLSMGMSSDYDIAIQEGATHVRVGSKIFGTRSKKDPS